jgi:nicotinamidase-related amidase
MSASLLDRDTTVLVIVDVQERLTAAMERRDDVLSAATFLVAVAGIVGAPVVITRQYPAGLGDTEPLLVDAIAAVEDAGTAVARADKVAFDCFKEPQFVSAVEALGRRQMVIVGMESHICVTQTAVSALGQGFDVHVVEDGCCSRLASAHESAMERIRAAGAVVTLAESAAYELVGEAGTPQFKALLGLVKARG